VTGEPLNADQRIAWLRLARAPAVGPVAFTHLIRRYGSPEKALAALPRLSARGGSRAAPAVPALAEAEAEIAAGEALGARLITALDPDFPAGLATLDPPPPLIWARGRPELLARPAVAIVGARIASAAGQRFARGLAGELGQAGYVVVSGMARGIDAAAHEGALATGTIAVLGGGVDDVYPPEHRGLYDRLAREGCVVSESEIGRRAQARDFPRRNRIISGLSLGVVVVEAELRSGSLITARLAGEQGRDVFAVPGSPLDPRARGTNDLIRQGAVLCEGVEDVLRVLASPLGRTVRAGPPANAAAEAQGLDEEIDALRSRIEALLSPTPIARDELVRLTGAPAAAVYGALVELSLAGRAELGPGGLAARA
jgi:DNA processing protein